jgi:hypothetical protein
VPVTNSVNEFIAEKLREVSDLLQRQQRTRSRTGLPRHSRSGRRARASNSRHAACGYLGGTGGGRARRAARGGAEHWTTASRQHPGRTWQHARPSPSPVPPRRGAVRGHAAQRRRAVPLGGRREAVAEDCAATVQPRRRGMAPHPSHGARPVALHCALLEYGAGPPARPDSGLGSDLLSRGWPTGRSAYGGHRDGRTFGGPTCPAGPGERVPRTLLAEQLPSACFVWLPARGRLAVRW